MDAKERWVIVEFWDSVAIEDWADIEEAQLMKPELCSIFGKVAREEEEFITVICCKGGKQITHTWCVPKCTTTMIEEVIFTES